MVTESPASVVSSIRAVASTGGLALALKAKGLMCIVFLPFFLRWVVAAGEPLDFLFVKKASFSDAAWDDLAY
jgi:hypothetical protein